jgi:hypothetical protein
MLLNTSRTVLAAAIISGASNAALAATPTFSTLYNFTNGDDGGFPGGNLAIGPNGVLYGTTRGGTSSVGNVFALTPPSSAGGSWTESVLYSFTGGSDGRFPFSGVVRSPQGVLYGTACEGGAYGWGVVFSLTPPASPGDSWTEQVLYNFTNGSDGGYPTQPLLLSGDGTLYGVTLEGGTQAGGVAFELIPPSSPGGSWTENVLHSFDYSSLAGAVGVTGFGGRLYGVTGFGSSSGAVYSLSPPPSGKGAWTYGILYSFTGGSDGGGPSTKLVPSADGVLYGTTGSGGAFGKGTGFSLTPPRAAGGSWTLTTICNFSHAAGGAGTFSLLVPTTGILYGVAIGGAYQDNGAIFQLNPNGSPGSGWTYTVLHYFLGEDGFAGGLEMGSGHVLYGVTFQGGADYAGTVFALQL